jgi:hypothetical protein
MDNAAFIPAQWAMMFTLGTYDDAKKLVFSASD